MMADLFSVAGFGLIEPIIAVYFVEGIDGGSIFAVGIASMIYLLTKSLVQLPFSKYVDGHNNKKRWLIIGVFVFSLVPFLYIFATNIYHIYLAQILYGIGSGLAYPTWLALWSTHLDKKHEAFEWSLYSTLTGVGAALSAALGAGLAQVAGYPVTFMAVGILSLIGCGILLQLNRKHFVKNSKTDVPWKHYHYHRRISQGDRHG